MYLYNGFWLVAVTMTTVGFGDYYPETYFGKIMILIGCFTGMFIVSMTMVTLSNAKDYTKN